MSHPTFRRQLASIAILAALSSPAWALTTIDFDGTGAPDLFVDTTPLTNLYSGLGVTFAGNGGSGGSILNQSGNFGFNARSGTDFLAFNTLVGTGYQEKISFDSSVSYVEIWAANVDAGSTEMFAYDGNGGLVTSSVIANSSDWQRLSVSGAGISSIMLVGSGSAFAYDDLGFDRSAAPVPEPETYAMLLAGLGLLGARLRKRRAAEA